MDVHQWPAQDRRSATEVHYLGFVSIQCLMLEEDTITAVTGVRGEGRMSVLEEPECQEGSKLGPQHRNPVHSES